MEHPKLSRRGCRGYPQKKTANRFIGVIPNRAGEGISDRVPVAELSVLGDQRSSIRWYLRGPSTPRVPRDEGVAPSGIELGVDRELPSTDSGISHTELGDHVGVPPSDIGTSHTEVGVHV